jgi:uncharacterized caspase-like protein/Tfp pilus assembly protein PilF
MFPANESVEQQPDSRRAEVVNLPTSYATYVDRWAIVVGISQYQHKSLNLKYADRDAEALYELLLTPSGGGFEKDHVIKLVNENATTANITRALRSFLKKPAKEDIVLIYFACHGGPDRERPDILYLITHDTDPDEIAGTGLPMREIKLSLRENLLAERVILIADTCHSAGLSGEGNHRGLSDSYRSDAINLYLKEASEAKKGLAFLASAAAPQASVEDEKWGGGHGVFTHFLLEGMRGAADTSPKNGVVTVRELFDYVQKEVKKATNNRQHPCIGNEMFDPNLPVAITAGISAQEHYELGCHLYQIGLKLDDSYCFESSSRHLRESIHQAAVIGGKLPEAHLQLGLALTSTGKLSREAIAAFENAIKAGIADADYHLGIAYLNQGEAEAARKHLEAFLSKQPDSDKAGAVQELLSWFDASSLSHSEAVKRYALLIGINYSESAKEGLSPYNPLMGCVNDIEILNEVLSQKFNFEVKMLPDMEATYENIINAFIEIQDKASPRDVVVIFFAGHENKGSWLAADVDLSQEDYRLNIIDSVQLYQLIEEIPAFNKHLIMDIIMSEDWKWFIARVNQSKLCILLFSASLGQVAYEVKIESTLKRHGFFSYTLVQELWESPVDGSCRDLFEKVREKVKSRFSGQVPFYLGDIEKSLFFASLEQYPETFTFSQRRCYSAFDNRSLQILHQKVGKQFTSIFPDFYHSLGLAFLEKGDSVQALALLETAVEHSKQKMEDKLIAFGISQLNNQFYTDALQTFQKLSEMFTPSVDSNLLDNIISTTEQLTKSKRCALLVGIDTSYTSYDNGDAVPATKDSVRDTLDLKNILVSKYGFQLEDIRVLNNQDATYQNILEAFNELVDNSRINSTLFYFAGTGSVDESDNPTILAFDSRTKDIPDILLSDLARLANPNEVNLVSVIDSCWTIGGEPFVECNESIVLTSTRKLFASFPFDENAIERDDSRIPKIGNLSIYSPSIKYRKCESLPKKLTLLLIQFLNAENLVTNTYQAFYQFYKNENRSHSDERYYDGLYFPKNIGISDMPVFDSIGLHSKILDQNLGRTHTTSRDDIETIN